MENEIVQFQTPDAQALLQSSLAQQAQFADELAALKAAQTPLSEGYQPSPTTGGPTTIGLAATEFGRATDPLGKMGAFLMSQQKDKAAAQRQSMLDKRAQERIAFERGETIRKNKLAKEKRSRRLAAQASRVAAVRSKLDKDKNFMEFAIQRTGQSSDEIKALIKHDPAKAQDLLNSYQKYRTGIANTKFAKGKQLKKLRGQIATLKNDGVTIPQRVMDYIANGNYAEAGKYLTALSLDTKSTSKDLLARKGFFNQQWKNIYFDIVFDALNRLKVNADESDMNLIKNSLYEEIQKSPNKQVVIGPILEPLLRSMAITPKGGQPSIISPDDVILPNGRVVSVYSPEANEVVKTIALKIASERGVLPGTEPNDNDMARAREQMLDDTNARQRSGKIQPTQEAPGVTDVIGRIGRELAVGLRNLF